MKNLRQIRLSLMAVFAAAGVAQSAGVSLSDWEHRQSVDVAKAGVVHVDLSTATLDSTNADLRDLCLLDPDGNEVPSHLARPELPTIKDQPPASFKIEAKSDVTEIVMETGTKSSIRSVTLLGLGSHFGPRTGVDISDDGKTWEAFQSPCPLTPIWGLGNRSELTFYPKIPHGASFIRLNIYDTGADVRACSGVFLNTLPPYQEYVPVATRITSREEFSDTTMLTVELEGRHLQYAYLEFQFHLPLEPSWVTVKSTDLAQSGRNFLLGYGTSFPQPATDPEPYGKRRVLMVQPPPRRKVFVRIQRQNPDATPPVIESLSALRPHVDLLFVAPRAGRYTLLSGNPKVWGPTPIPHEIVETMYSEKFSVVLPGPIENIPEFRPPAAAPQARPFGAPIDASAWRYHRSVTIASPGVQEMELDPDALANARSDFADVRLAFSGSQVPYWLDRPELYRDLPVPFESLRDPKRPSVSRWKVTLPKAGLPMRRMLLRSKSPVFKRHLTVIENQTDPEGNDHPVTLRSMDWMKTTAADVQESCRVDLNSERPTTDTLWVEMDDADNPAIEISSISVEVPVVRLVFDAATTTGCTLLYGNPAATAPRYDFNLAPKRLLTSDRVKAKLDSGAASDTSRQPFKRIDERLLFWGTLSFVVIILLVIIAKSLPKAAS